MNISKTMLKLLPGVWSEDPSKQLESTMMVKDLLLQESPNPHTDEVIESGVLPRFLEFITWNDKPDLQHEAACALGLIAFGTLKHTDVLVALGAVPIFVKVLDPPTGDFVCEKVIWALGALALASVMYRDLVLNCGVLLPMLRWVHLYSDLTLLRIAAWTLANLCEGKPQAPFEQLAPALPGLELLVRLDDEEAKENACRALDHLSSSFDGLKIQSIIEAGVLPRLVNLLQDPSPSVLTLALNIVSNIVTGDTQQTQCVIHCGALPHLASLLTQDYTEGIKQDACWTVGKITAGTEEQIQSVIDANLIPTLINLAQNGELELKGRAVWAISNAISAGSDDQIKYLVEQNCIKPLCDLLSCLDLRIISCCLEGLENILRAGEAEKNPGEVNHYYQLIVDAKGVEKIENLLRHEDQDICLTASRTLGRYYWLGLVEQLLSSLSDMWIQKVQTPKE